MACGRRRPLAGVDFLGRAMFDGIRNFFGWLGGIAGAVSGRVVAVVTFWTSLFSAISAGVVSLYSRFSTWLGDITSFVSDFASSMTDFSADMGQSGLFGFGCYLLGLDTAAEMFLRLVPSLIVGFFVFWVAVFGLFCTFFALFGVYVAIKRVVAAVTLGFCRV